ncbi:MAG: glycoside hydrolase family 127 protein [Bacteroidales bacterium]
MKNIKSLLVLVVIAMILQSCSQKRHFDDYPVTPVPFTDVKIFDHFWLPAIIRNSEVTIPIAFKQSEETGRIANFEVAGGLKPGTFNSLYPFDDSDVFKIIEGASYALMIRYDPDLDLYLDNLIHKIAAAQEEDGYLYTNRTILGDSAHEMAGKHRWENVSMHSHELYNAGHMFEAAVAHYMATRKRTFLDVAIKNADLLDQVFGSGKIEKYPGHQEIEIGLVKLYRVTGDNRYLDLARFFLDIRGPGGWEYNQAHLKPLDQTEPAGHAVRALYMYAAMADVAALTGDQRYNSSLGHIWDNLITTRYYITGGVGQLYENEGFGPAWHLPNLTAYCETCASIAFVLWNYRMFLLHGEARYMDVLERTLYNSLIAGVSQSGDLFFYPNPLESDGRHHRKEWFGCACCPSNITRFLPSVSGYIFAYEDKKLYLNLFISSEASFTMNGHMVGIRVDTDYPLDGKVEVELNPEEPVNLKIYIRWPGWAQGMPVPGNLYRFADESTPHLSVFINGEPVSYISEKGYLVLSKLWERGDRISFELPMQVNRIIAHDSVTENTGKVALQCGPLIYCIEDIDQPAVDIHSVKILPAHEIQPDFDSGLLNKTRMLVFNAVDDKVSGDTLTIKAIPYYLWANRGPSNMRVWIPFVGKNPD